jgi:SAM-dependent methyltransferase
MAITRQLAEAILAEHKYREVSGDVLLLGRQMVFMTPDEAQRLVEQAGFAIRPDAHIDFDRTPHGRERDFISDSSFFSLFTGAPVRASDVSDYEGADIIFDLSGTLPAEVNGAFDFIYNGSVLDNVFDPATCIKNISRMLRANGVVIHYEGMAHFGWAYLKFSPDWFFDYYALNDFADAQFYLCAFEHFHRSSWDVYEWSPFVNEDGQLKLTSPISFPQEVLVLAIAQKGQGSSNDSVPLQNLYRGSEHAPYERAFRRFEKSARRESFRKALRPSLERDNSLRSRLDLLRTALLNKPRTPLIAGHLQVGCLGQDKPDQKF